MLNLGKKLIVLHWFFFFVNLTIIYLNFNEGTISKFGNILKTTWNLCEEGGTPEWKLSRLVANIDF